MRIEFISPIVNLLLLVPVDTKCFKSIKDYDERKLNGSLGSMEMRPSCDGRGFYAPYKCIPGQT